MKKIFSIVFVSLLLSFSFFAQEIYSEKDSKIFVSKNHSYLTEEFVGSDIKITGLLEANKNTFVLKENPDSRSVVTFVLEVKKWSLKRKLKKLNGQTVTVSGILTKASSTWTKKMKVISIE